MGSNPGTSDAPPLRRALASARGAAGRTPMGCGRLVRSLRPTTIESPRPGMLGRHLRGETIDPLVRPPTGFAPTTWLLTRRSSHAAMATPFRASPSVAHRRHRSRTDSSGDAPLSPTVSPVMDRLPIRRTATPAAISPAPRPAGHRSAFGRAPLVGPNRRGTPSVPTAVRSRSEASRSADLGSDRKPVHAPAPRVQEVTTVRRDRSIVSRAIVRRIGVSDAFTRQSTLPVRSTLSRSSLSRPPLRGFEGAARRNRPPTTDPSALPTTRPAHRAAFRSAPAIRIDEGVTPRQPTPAMRRAVGSSDRIGSRARQAQRRPVQLAVARGATEARKAVGPTTKTSSVHHGQAFHPTRQGDPKPRKAGPLSPLVSNLSPMLAASALHGMIAREARRSVHTMNRPSSQQGDRPNTPEPHAPLRRAVRTVPAMPGMAPALAARQAIRRVTDARRHVAQAGQSASPHSDGTAAATTSAAPRSSTDRRLRPPKERTRVVGPPSGHHPVPGSRASMGRHAAGLPAMSDRRSASWSALPRVIGSVVTTAPARVVASAPTRINATNTGEPSPGAGQADRRPTQSTPRTPSPPSTPSPPNRPPSGQRSVRPAVALRRQESGATRDSARVPVSHTKLTSTPLDNQPRSRPSSSPSSTEASAARKRTATVTRSRSSARAAAASTPHIQRDLAKGTSSGTARSQLAGHDARQTIDMDRLMLDLQDRILTEIDRRGGRYNGSF